MKWVLLASRKKNSDCPSRLLQILLNEDILFGGTTLQGLAFLSECKAATEVLPEGPFLIAPGGLIKGAFFLDRPQWENETHSQ